MKTASIFFAALILLSTAVLAGPPSPDCCVPDYDRTVINERGEHMSSYRKTRLYARAERNSWSFGDAEPTVVEFFGFPVGVLKHHESELPELTEILALRGAMRSIGPTAADCYSTLPDGSRSATGFPPTVAFS